MRSKLATAVALVLSTLLHGVLVGVVGRAARGAEHAEAPAAQSVVTDVWGGETLELASLLVPLDVREAAVGRAGRLGEPAQDSASAPPDEGSSTQTLPEAIVRLAEPAPSVAAPSKSLPARQPRPLSKAPQPPAVPISGASDSPGGASPTATGAAPPQDDELAAASGSGAVGRRGVRHLATAFTRAVPIANAGDPIWRRLPVGDAGQVQVQIVVDDAGHIQAADLLRASTVPAHLRKLVDNTLVMLRAGTFALAYAGGVSAGSQILRIEVRISRVDGGVAARDLSAGPFSLGHEPPRDGRPGRAHFTLRTGEHVEVTVRVVRGT